MARRDAYERVGWFDPQFGNYSDVDMWLRMVWEYDVAYVDEPLIDLMPKDPTRFYSFVHWKVLFWLLGIHVKNLLRYSDVLPTLVATLRSSYPARRRRLLIREMLICLKHRRWDRVAEGLANPWRDADDPFLSAIGRLFGNPKSLPAWYEKRYWDLVRADDRYLRDLRPWTSRIPPWRRTPGGEYSAGSSRGWLPFIRGHRCHPVDLLVPLFLRAWGADGYGGWLTLTAFVSYLGLLDLGGRTTSGTSWRSTTYWGMRRVSACGCRRGSPSSPSLPSPLSCSSPPSFATLRSPCRAVESP